MGRGTGERVRGLGCGSAPGTEVRERRGAGALPRACHGGGEVAAAEHDRSSVARGGGHQRGWEWGQGVAGVPRVAVGSRRWPVALPWRRAAPLYAGGRGSREGERKMTVGLVCKFRKV